MRVQQVGRQHAAVGPRQGELADVEPADQPQEPVVRGGGTAFQEIRDRRRLRCLRGRFAQPGEALVEVEGVERRRLVGRRHGGLDRERPPLAGGLPDLGEQVGASARVEESAELAHEVRGRVRRVDEVEQERRAPERAAQLTRLLLVPARGSLRGGEPRRGRSRRGLVGVVEHDEQARRARRDDVDGGERRQGGGGELVAPDPADEAAVEPDEPPGEELEPKRAQATQAFLDAPGEQALGLEEDEADPSQQRLVVVAPGFGDVGHALPPGDVRRVPRQLRRVAQPRRRATRLRAHRHRPARVLVYWAMPPIPAGRGAPSPPARGSGSAR